MTVACATLRPLPSHVTGLPRLPEPPFPTCRAHYPGGSSGCACRLLPRSCSLPQMAGGSASALSLSRPAQATLTLRPIGSLRQLPDQSTTIRVESSSTDDDSRPRGALPLPDS